MSGPALEALLARLYVDEHARRRFLADPAGEAARAGLSGKERASLGQIDRLGLELAAASYARKRAQAAAREPRGWPRRLADLLRRWLQARP